MTWDGKRIVVEWSVCPGRPHVVFALVRDDRALLLAVAPFALPGAVYVRSVRDPEKAKTAIAGVAAEFVRERSVQTGLSS